MSPLALEQVTIEAEASPLSFQLQPGEWLALAGPEGGGKRALFRVLADFEKPLQGAVVRGGKLAVAQAGTLSRRAKPASLARGEGASELLVSFGLSTHRSSSLSELPDSLVAACELLDASCSGAELLLIDGQCDRLDPWMLEGVWSALRRRAWSAVLLTNRPDLMERCERLLVMKGGAPRFLGEPEELVRQAGPQELTIASDRQGAARALLEPFAVDVRSEPVGLCVSAREAQELSAKLLTEGYGNVRLIVSRPSTLAEALLTL